MDWKSPGGGRYRAPYGANNRLFSKNVAILELGHSDLVNFLPFIDARNLILRLAVLGKQAVVGFRKSDFCMRKPILIFKVFLCI